MKETKITAFAEISVPETTPLNSLPKKLKTLPTYCKKQGGYIDGEMVQLSEVNA